MLINLTWIKEFVPLTASVEEICSALTQRGFEVESINTPLSYLDTICVGEVLSCDKHPSADNLSVCVVSVGTETYHIVCGARNVRAGIRVPVALEGTVMPNGLTINKVKLRGVESCGMICSEAELGITSESNGIWILPSDAPLGQSIASYFHVADTVIDISITPNRSDCLSLIGIARELALFFSLPLTMPSTSYDVSDRRESDVLDISVEDSCSSYYTLQVIRNIAVIPTPAQMRFRLLSVGIRSISFIVDITNYVMMELGQPLHAFDANSFARSPIKVRYARDGEECTTLDSVTRKLESTDIVVSNDDGICAIAGVMGASSSEVCVTTQNIVLESAIFNPVAVRKTSKRLGLSTEASYRFERGVDRGNVDCACNRVISLILQYTSADVSSTRVVVVPENDVVIPPILFRPEKARSLLGLTIDDVVIQDMIESLHCNIEKKDFFWKITPPTYRLDITQEADIIEEIARLYGMDSIPIALPSIRYNAVLHAIEDKYQQTVRTKRILEGLGLTEVISYSFIAHDLLERIEGDMPHVRIQNPLSAEYDVLRTRLLPSLLLAMQKNYNNGASSLALFEVASIFAPQHNETGVHEKESLAILLSGYTSVQEWGYPKTLWDYRDIKGILLQYIQAITSVPCSFKSEQHRTLSPCVRVIVGGENIGVIGRITPTLASEFDVRYPVWYAEISLNTLYKYTTKTATPFTPLPLYPSMSRDITFIVEETCGIGTLLDSINALQETLIEQCYCIDVYTNMETNEKHVTIRIVLRDKGKTLTDKEADTQRDKVVQYVSKLHNARV